MTQQEHWLDIPGYEGFYRVSNHGKVCSLDRYVTNSLGRTYLIAGRIMKQKHDISGYLCVGLTKNGKQTVYKVHRLVACAFLGMPIRTGCEKTINHIDGIKTNNCLNNLEIVSQYQNNRHAIRIGLVNHNGESNGRAKLSIDDIIKIREYAISHTNSAGRLLHGTIRTLANQYHVNDTTIKKIITGKLWKSVTIDIKSSSYK